MSNTRSIHWKSEVVALQKAPFRVGGHARDEEGRKREGDSAQNT